MKAVRRIFLVITLGLSLVLFLAGIGLPQSTGEGKAEVPAKQAAKITITGKIVYMKSYGGYIVISEKPHEEYKILNANEKILSALAKKGKPVTIEGVLPRGAYLLQIDKIDGKKYP